nr:putative EF-hand domain pair, reverse transcriptase, RNA-dependent DNA polymerase [Tanacetum cinerariifolium]
MTNMIVTTPVNVTGVSVTNTLANHAEKPEKFNGQNFKRWQQKMFFYLRTLNLARFLNETAPQVEPPKEGQPSNAQAVQAVEAWKHSDFWFRLELDVSDETAHVVNVMFDEIVKELVNFEMNTRYCLTP